MNQKSKFTRKFKLSIIQELESKRLSEVCRAHNLAPSTASDWRTAYENNHPFMLNVLSKRCI